LRLQLKHKQEAAAPFIQAWWRGAALRLGLKGTMHKFLHDMYVPATPWHPRGNCQSVPRKLACKKKPCYNRFVRVGCLFFFLCFGELDFPRLLCSCQLALQV
jgi:hypothetical protein